MPHELIAFLAGVGVAGWVYAKFSRSTGGNTRSSLLGAGLVGVVVFIVVFTLVKMIPQ